MVARPPAATSSELRKAQNPGRRRSDGNSLIMFGSHIAIAADRGGMAAGRDINVGILLDQLPAILRAATDPLEQLNAAQLETITRLEKEIHSTREQVLGFFRFIGEADIQLE